MPPIEKQKILKGRGAIDDYRIAHTALHKKEWHRGIPEEHTPLLIKALDILKEQGFYSLEEFFNTSEELNMQELGFKDRKDFEAKATEAGREALDGKWR